MHINNKEALMIVMRYRSDRSNEELLSPIEYRLANKASRFLTGPKISMQAPDPCFDAFDKTYMEEFQRLQSA